MATVPSTGAAPINPASQGTAAPAAPQQELWAPPYWHHRYDPHRYEDHVLKDSLLGALLLGVGNLIFLGPVAAVRGLWTGGLVGAGIGLLDDRD